MGGMDLDHVEARPRSARRAPLAKGARNARFPPSAHGYRIIGKMGFHSGPPVASALFGATCVPPRRAKRAALAPGVRELDSGERPVTR